MLNFFGNGSGFSETHTGAYFFLDNNLIIIDCSMLNLKKILSLNPWKYNCYVFITHMHDDHISGLGMFIQNMKYVHEKDINIVIPFPLENDLRTDLTIKGIPDNLYNLYLSCDVYIKNLSVGCIETQHCPELRCFGYVFDVNGNRIVYTGDTNTIEPFKDFVIDGSELYIDVSASYGKVHLKFDEIKDELIELSKIADVYIMHIDDELLMREKIRDTNIKIAEIS